MVPTQESWAIVTTAAGRYIGNVARDGGPLDYIVLNPCYEYLSDIQASQGPNGQINVVGRTRTVLPYDHTLAPVPVRIRAVSIAYINEMGDTDKANYMQMIEETRQRVDASRLRRDSGISIASSIPKNLITTARS